MISTSRSRAPSTTPKSYFEITSIHGLRGNLALTSRRSINWSSTDEHLSPAPPLKSITYITAVGRWDMAASVNSSISLRISVLSRRRRPGESIIWQSWDTAKDRLDMIGSMVLEASISRLPVPSPASTTLVTTSFAPTLLSSSSSSSPSSFILAKFSSASSSLILLVFTPLRSNFSCTKSLSLGILTPATLPAATSSSLSQNT
mmetsp:Transcript_9256/g.15322  ORF Transcript_9256/g.15322 Transcript_9256/m.15322 type:complete len:203 (-) Transcript_9256:242-850(-)